MTQRRPYDAVIARAVERETALKLKCAALEERAVKAEVALAGAMAQANIQLDAALKRANHAEKATASITDELAKVRREQHRRGRFLGILRDLIDAQIGLEPPSALFSALGLMLAGGVATAYLATKMLA